jgi:hypothetical protein
MPVLQEWDNPHLVTLTRRNVDGQDLSGAIDEMLAAFNSCKRSIKRTEKLEFKAVRKTECTYNIRRNDFHPHYHVIVEGQRQAELLRDKWVDRYDGEADIAGQDVRPCDENTLMEVFKYFTKLTTKATTGERRITPPEALDVIFSAMRGRRVWQPVGFKLRANEDEQIESDELEVSGTPAFKRSAEKVLWEWEQDLTDWVDLRTGECLSEYRPPDKLARFVEQASSKRDSNAATNGEEIGPTLELDLEESRGGEVSARDIGSGTSGKLVSGSYKESLATKQIVAVDASREEGLERCALGVLSKPACFRVPASVN